MIKNAVIGTVAVIAGLGFAVGVERSQVAEDSQYDSIGALGQLGGALFRGVTGPLADFHEAAKENARNGGRPALPAPSTGGNGAVPEATEPAAVNRDRQNVQSAGFAGGEATDGISLESLIEGE